MKQYRSDYGPRVLALRMTAGRTALTITRLELSSPSLRRAAVWTGERELAAGQTIDFRAPLPEAVCGHATADPRMHIAFRLDDGRTGTATIRATQSLHDLDRIQSLDCAADRADAIAPIVGATLDVDGRGLDSVAVLGIRITPTGGTGSYRIVDVRSTVLLAPAGSEATRWPLSVPVSAGDPASVLPLRIVPTRCDAHVIAEDKVGTILPVDVRYDDGTSGRFPLPLADGVKSQLLDFVAAHCGI